MKKYLTLIAAIVFTSIAAFGRNGAYVEFKLSSSTMNGTVKTYSSDRDSRTEVTVHSPSMPNPATINTLQLGSAPGKIFMLNEADKSYMEMDANRSAADHKEDDEYDITVLGRERVNEYNCVHVKVLNKRNRHESEMWLSKDVKGYASFYNIKNKYFGGSKFFNALQKKGAEGFVVRIVATSERGGQVQMDLVKVELQNVSESLFSLSGYTMRAGLTSPGSGGTIPGMKSQEEMQKMSPEDRKAYIEELRAKYQQPQH